MCNKDSRTTLLSGVDSLPWLVMTSLLFVSLSCTVTSEIAPALKLDERYAKEIVFDVIGLTIPLDEHQFIRSDGAVDDMDAHAEQLISELGLEHAKIVQTNPARFGRHMRVPFDDGRFCSFIWVLKRGDKVAELSDLQHEKYHALCALKPDAVDALSARLQELGYHIDLSKYEEELGAQIVDVISTYELGYPYVVGTGMIMDAVEIIAASKNPPRDPFSPELEHSRP